MPHKPGSKGYRAQLRGRLARLGVNGRQLVEQVVVDLMRCGCRPREAWRLACELTQDEVAIRFDQIRGDPDIRMRGSRICEYEKWPVGGVRPSVRTLKVLAVIYETTWDRLVDVDDLEGMPTGDKQAFLDIGDLLYGDSLNLTVSRQGRRPSPPRDGDDLRLNQPVTAEESLTSRERLTAPSSGSTSERPGGGLPGEVTHFTGRDGPMAELRAQLAANTPHGMAVTICAIDGMAGVGKTAFARHVAHELATHYPDGAIWIDLHGHTPGMQALEPFSALEQMLLQLGVPPESIKTDLTERQYQWRHHLHARRILIILDNALASDQVLPLLPETPDCLVLITSRRKLTGLTDAYPLSLDVLGWEEAERLFVKLVGEQRCEDQDAVRQILAACGRLPLAIRLIAGRLRHHRDELLAEVAADFADHAAALDALVAEHLSVRAAFEWSYRIMTDAQRRAFRLLGWHPGPEITQIVICAIANVSPTHGKQLLRELVDHNLLDQLSAVGIPGGPRYRMHDLVRLYAQERADAEEPLEERDAVVCRLAGSYLVITRETDRWLRPYLGDAPGEGTPRRIALAFVDASQARTWLSVERHNLLECVGAASPSAEAADLSTVLAVYFRDLGFWSDVRYLYSQALIVYRQLADQRGEADALRGLGYAEFLVAKYSQAHEYYTQALALARQLGDRRTEADALWGLGQVERHLGEYGQARDYHTQALTLARHLGDRAGEIDALWGLGEVERLVGEYDQARQYHTQTLALAQQLGDRFTKVLALRGLGQLERLVGDYRQARDYHTQALTLARQLGARPEEAEALRGLGQLEWLVGKYGQARDYHTQALILAQQLGDRAAEADVLRGLGEVKWLVGEYDQAREDYTQALALARHLGYRPAEILALRGLGEVERIVGENSQAREYYTQALTLARHLGDRPGEVLVLRGLGEVERLVGEYGQARDYHTQALALAQQFAYRRGEVLALQGLGDVERLVGEYGQAHEYHTQALALAQQLGDRHSEAEALWGLGHIATCTGERSQARRSWRKALEIYEELGLPFAETIRAAIRQL